MENAVDALKMAAAVLVFVIALTLGISVLSQARATSEAVLYAEDDTNFYEYISPTEDKEERVVGVESIVPTLYRYYKENYTVVFKDQNGNFMTLYETTTNTDKWTSDYFTKRDNTGIANRMYGKRSKQDAKEICSFDLTEETKRKEPWTSGGGSVILDKEIKLNLDAFIYGREYIIPYDTLVSSKNKISYNNFRGYPSFYEFCANNKFTEKIGEYAINYEDDSNENITDSETTIEIDGEIIHLVKPKKKRIITYTLVPKN